jgi:hypothetical protein
MEGTGIGGKGSPELGTHGFFWTVAIRVKPQVLNGERGNRAHYFRTIASTKIVCQVEIVVNGKCTGITQV